MQLQVDTSGLIRLQKGLKELGNPRMNRVLYRANNAVGGTTRTIIKTNLVKETSLPSAHVLSRFKTNKAHSKNPTYHISVKDRHVRLIEFKGRQLKKMVTSAKVWGKRQKYKGTFIATMSNGRQGIFHHIKGRTARGNQKIAMLYGPALPKELVRGDSWSLMTKHIKQAFPKNVDRFMQVEIRGVKAKHRL
ncbi:MAG: phage tail protein [Rhizobiales bacterium]|nr:phage tail protein [Hyphomicrobiales bacterium]NRB13092.1 phage tail protein [Hyphomicrobiales bacterium]